MKYKSLYIINQVNEYVYNFSILKFFYYQNDPLSFPLKRTCYWAKTKTYQYTNIVSAEIVVLDQFF
jgi:hypothetical protein